MSCSFEISYGGKVVSGRSPCQSDLSLNCVGFIGVRLSSSRVSSTTAIYFRMEFPSPGFTSQSQPHSSSYLCRRNSSHLFIQLLEIHITTGLDRFETQTKVRNHLILTNIFRTTNISKLVPTPLPNHSGSVLHGALVLSPYSFFSSAKFLAHQNI